MNIGSSFETFILQSTCNLRFVAIDVITLAFYLFLFIKITLWQTINQKKDQRDRSQVSGSENYEIQYFKDKLGVSSQAVTGAIRATGSNDRKTLEAYLKDKHK